MRGSRTTYIDIIEFSASDETIVFFFEGWRQLMRLPLHQYSSTYLLRQCDCGVPDQFENGTDAVAVHAGIGLGKHGHDLHRVWNLTPGTENHRIENGLRRLVVEPLPHVPVVRHLIQVPLCEVLGEEEANGRRAKPQKKAVRERESIRSHTTSRTRGTKQNSPASQSM